MSKILNSGPLFIVIAATLWALDGIIRRSLFELPPAIIVFYEHLFGAILISPYVIIGLKKEKITTKEWLLLAFISLLSGVLGTLFFTTALIKVNFISFSVVFLLQKLQPIFAISTAAIFLKEKISKDYLIWAFLALVSAYFVTFKNGYVNLATGSQTIIAAAFALGAAAAWGSSTTISKIALKEKSNTTITGLRFIITTPLALATVFIVGSANALTSPNLSQLLRFLIIALSTGMVALWIYYKGLKKTPVKVSTILELTFPVLAIFIDAFVYKTFLIPTQTLAAAVLLFSMYRISKLRNLGE